MNQGHNIKLVELIGSEELIRDKKLTNLFVHLSGEISIVIEIIDENSNTFELEFLSVKSFNFAGDINFDKGGIIISHYKLFVLNENLVYFSFDPYDEEKVVSDDDNNYLIAELIKFNIKGEN